MAPFSPRWGFGLSLAVAVIAVVYLRLQHPFFRPSSPGRTYCYSGGVTASFGSRPPSHSHANCFTVTDGLFTDIFAASQKPKPVPDVVDMLAGHAIPGLWDGHGHLLQYGEFLHSVDLFRSSSIDEVKTRLVRYLRDHAGAGTKDDWIRGVGWDQMALGTMPTAAMLEDDGRLKGTYMMLDRVDVHCVWVSQAVLDLLPKDLGDIPGGEIIRDPGMGVFCDNAMDVVTALWPRPDSDRKKTFLKSAMASLHSVGLVGVHDAGVTPGDLALYKDMAATEDWTLRVYAMMECKERNTFCPEKVSRFAQEDGLLTVSSVKLFADGALGSWGSAMIEPYTDRPDMDPPGSLLVNGSTLTSLAKSWSAEGYQVNIHAIGDLANRLAVDALEAALVDLCPAQMVSACQAARRFRIEHAQIIHPHDLARMRSIGIVPSIQPTHATSDMAYAELRLGRERTASEAYRMRSLLGLRPVLGSDFPVEPPAPLEGVYAAVARKSPHTGQGPGGLPDGWYPEESLTLREALAGFTEGPAHGAFLEGKAGVIQPRAFADWVVVDQPLDTLDVEDLRNLRIRETWVGGKQVYSAQ